VTFSGKPALGKVVSMDNRFDILTLIAERKILEAIEQGQFDNLAGAGKPLPLDDLANLPDDLRLAWRILRSANYNDQSPPPGQTIGLGDMFAQAPEEGRVSRSLTRLKLKLEKGHNGASSHQALESTCLDILESPYLDKLLQKTSEK
jgi:hypothetical protein